MLKKRLETSRYHVSDDIRLVFFRLDRVPTQGHVVALLDPHEVDGRLCRSCRAEGQNSVPFLPTHSVPRSVTVRCHSRALLVRTVTAAVAGPWPMLLKPFTASRYTQLPSSPVRTMDVSFLAVLCFRPDSSWSPSLQ